MTDHAAYGEWFERALGEHDVRLSASGRARKVAIRRSLQSLIVRRRRLRRAAPVLAVAVLLAAATWLWRPVPRPARPAPRRLVRIVHDDPTVMARCVVHGSQVGAGVLIDDGTLLRLLRAAGRPTGLIRIGGRARPSAPVADRWSD